MTFRIPKGKHRALPLRFGFWWNRSVFSWLVKFDASCRYDFAGPDQLDTNKLVGIGYLPGHHIDSARFGWRYDAAKDRVEIMAYCYVGGQRSIKHVADAKIDEQCRLRLEAAVTGYWFAATGQQEYYGEIFIRHNHRKKFQYRLGTYFGGNQAAPHDINIQIEKA